MNLQKYYNCLNDLKNKYYLMIHNKQLNKYFEPSNVNSSNNHIIFNEQQGLFKN